MKGLFSQARSAEGAERARAEREALLQVSHSEFSSQVTCCMFQLIVNADTKFACKIIVIFRIFLSFYMSTLIMNVDKITNELPNHVKCLISQMNFRIMSNA